MIVIEYKTEKITFRVTPNELQKIESKAKKANMRISEYLRYSALNKRIIIIDDLNDLTRELQGIGKNLNQLTILCHQGKIIVADLSSVKKVVEEIWQLLNLLMEKMKK